MINAAFAGHPFGHSITEETLRQTFLPLKQWEDKYRQLILLGKQLPSLSDELKAQAREIAGCENRVWLGCTAAENGTLHFWRQRRSDRSRYAGRAADRHRRQTAAGLLAGDPLALFDELGLRAELSASRNQGLAALAAAVQDAARQALA
jgi:cysteine desulfuration protein SufE